MKTDTTWIGTGRGMPGPRTAIVARMRAVARFAPRVAALPVREDRVRH